MLHFARLWRRSPMKIKSPKDFWAGLMFIGFGLFFVIWALIYYQMGTAVRMGPAYFPAVLGGLLAGWASSFCSVRSASKDRRYRRSASRRLSSLASAACSS